jgi:hypothetical protein
LNRSPSTAGPADWYARWVRLNNKRLVFDFRARELACYLAVLTVICQLDP